MNKELQNHQNHQNHQNYQNHQNHQDHQNHQNKAIYSHHQLELYQLSFEAAMAVFEITKAFPNEEKFSLTDQLRRSSRSICANIAEAWRKRRYEAAFISKLNDAEAEAAETQTWIQFSVTCGYLKKDTGQQLYEMYNRILGRIVNMVNKPEPWLMNKRGK